MTRLARQRAKPVIAHPHIARENRRVSATPSIQIIEEDGASVVALRDREADFLGSRCHAVDRVLDRTGIVTVFAHPTLLPPSEFIAMPGPTGSAEKARHIYAAGLLFRNPGSGILAYHAEVNQQDQPSYDGQNDASNVKPVCSPEAEQAEHDP